MAYKHLTFNDRLKIEAWQKDDKPAEILRYYKIPIMSLKLYLMENLIKIGLYLLIYQKKDTVTQVPNSKNAPEIDARDELASPVSAKIITKTNDVVNQKSINNKNLTG